MIYLHNEMCRNPHFMFSSLLSNYLQQEAPKEDWGQVTQSKIASKGNFLTLISPGKLSVFWSGGGLFCPPPAYFRNDEDEDELHEDETLHMQLGTWEESKNSSNW